MTIKLSSSRRKNMFRLTNNQYDSLKWIAQYLLPALASLYATIGKIWNLPYTVEISATLMALDTFLGVCLGISSANYYTGDEYD